MRLLPKPAPERRLAVRDRAVVVGTLTASIAALILLPVAFVATIEQVWGWLVFVVFGAVGEGLLMGGGWYLLFSRVRCTRGRGALLGGLVGVLSHYFVWVLVGMGGAVVGGDLMLALTSLLVALPLSLASLIMLGWLSVPVTALIGWSQGGAS